MDQFPIIIFPHEVIKIFKSTPALSKEPIKPILKTDNNLADAKGCSNFGIVFIILAIICAFSFSSIANDGNSRGTFFYLGLISFVVGIFMFFFSNSLKTGVVDSKVLQSNYEKELQGYKIDYANWLKNKLQIESNEYIHDWRINEVKNFYKKMTDYNAFSPSQNDDLKNKKGTSEEFFYYYLSHYFKDYVQKGAAVILQGNPNRKFIPDFVCKFSEEVIIDVEIDEPYIGATGEPIHYRNSADNTRNKYFNRNGWIVVRFAEEQVVKYPNECCQLITKVGEYALNNYHHLLDKSILSKCTTWTKEQAHKMAFARYRNTYLGIELAENIKSETFSNLIDIDPDNYDAPDYQL